MTMTSPDGKERAKFVFCEEFGFGNVLRVSEETETELPKDLGVAVYAGGRLGPGAKGLSESEIAEAFALYHKFADPELPHSWSCSGKTLLAVAEYWELNQETVKEFEQALAWLRWKLEQRSEIEKVA